MAITLRGLPYCLLGLCLALAAPTLSAQLAAVRGTVTVAETGAPIDRARISIVGTARTATTGPSGHFVLEGVPVGRQVVRVVLIGYAPVERQVVVGTPEAEAIALAMQPVQVSLADLVVTAVSRVAERLVAAPGAVARLDAVTGRDLAITGQPALALATLPGVDLVQVDVQDFNVNARGFNTAFNRRVLVLQDGRDLSIAFTGSQEWLGMSSTLEDMATVEFVRGPSAALYGANAFSGVLNLTTPLARETVGSRISLAGGGLGSLRTDVRHAGVLGQGRWGYRLTGGYSRSEAWARSRTNLGDLSREYAPAIDTTGGPVAHPFPGFELRPLNGQRLAGPMGVPGVALGSADPVTGLYATARLDRYADDGSVLTVEGGQARTRNATLLGSASRFQITQSLRPWARVAWADRRFHLMAYYSGRTGTAQQNLAAGTESLDRSHLLHLEGQFNRFFAGTRGRVIAGGSFRSSSVNTEGTLIAPRYDDRTDRFTALFAQVEFELRPQLKVVGAGRFDGSNLFTRQLSPKAALVFTPRPSQAFRVSVGRAFQMPNSLDFFVSVPAGPPADFSALEASLRASPLGPALAAVPQGQLFTASSAVPLLALGNTHLGVERVTSWEVGYKGQWGPLFVEANGYYSIMNDFVTDVLPGVNPTYAPWTAPSAVPEAQRAIVAAAVRDALAGAGQALAASALTRLEDGSTAMVVSIGNAGRATVRGLELDATWQVTRAWQLNANAAVFGFDLAASTFVPGDVVEANTPARTGNVALRYAGPQGLDMGVSVHATSAHQWAAGTFVGPVPATETVNATASYLVRPGLRLQLAGTNVLDQRRYQQFGGAVIGRRVVGGIQLRF